MSWKKISKNPISIKVHQYLLKQFFLIRKNSKLNILDEYIVEKCKSKKVLDIGIVEHTMAFTFSPHWKHKKIVEASKYCLGIDILKNELKKLKTLGYNVKHADATSNIYLGEKFDVIIVGDVIEHVDNPKNLLLFIKRHLKINGTALISTPNPFFIEYIFRFIKEGVFIANAEHISWITPTMMMELCRRTKMTLMESHTVKSYRFYGVKNIFQLFRRLIVYIFIFFFPRSADFFSPSYVYILKK